MFYKQRPPIFAQYGHLRNLTHFSNKRDILLRCTAHKILDVEENVCTGLELLNYLHYRRGLGKKSNRLLYNLGKTD